MGKLFATRFRVQIDKMHERQWSIGIALSHNLEETYFYLNLIKWHIAIGFLYTDC